MTGLGQPRHGDDDVRGGGGRGLGAEVNLGPRVRAAGPGGVVAVAAVVETARVETENRKTAFMSCLTSNVSRQVLT